MNSTQKTLSLAVAVALIIYVVISINPPKKTGLDPLKTGPDPLTVSPIIETDFADTAFPVIFEAAYTRRTSVKQDYEYYNFSVERIGNIKLPSGKVIAC